MGIFDRLFKRNPQIPTAPTKEAGDSPHLVNRQSNGDTFVLLRKSFVDAHLQSEEITL
jgi:hypothetical protein